MNEIKVVGYELFVILHFLGMIIDDKYSKTYMSFWYTLIALITSGMILSRGA